MFYNRYNHPHWWLKNSSGERITFFLDQKDWWVIGPAYPVVCDDIGEKYRELVHQYGYNYLSLVFCAPCSSKATNNLTIKKTTLKAYRMGLKVIRSFC